MFLYLGREGGGGDGMLHTSFFFKPLGNKIYSIAYVVAKTLGGAGKGITPGIPPLYDPPPPLPPTGTRRNRSNIATITSTLNC